MKGAVDVLDYVDHLEIWNHARLMNNLKSNPITAQDEKTLSQVLSAPRMSRVIDWKNKDGRVHGKERRFGVHRRVHGNSRNHLNPAIRGARTDSTERVRVA
jgi:hypothetical protein